jgi:hypothetical protein
MDADPHFGLPLRDPPDRGRRSEVRGRGGVEAARLAQAAGHPVSLRWTRREEFTWAYFRPAAVNEIEAGLDEKNRLAVWHFVNINAGGAGVETPYRAGKHQSQSVRMTFSLTPGFSPAGRGGQMPEPFQRLPVPWQLSLVTFLQAHEPFPLTQPSPQRRGSSLGRRLAGSDVT